MDFFRRYLVPAVLLALMLVPCGQAQDQDRVRFSLPEVAPWAQMNEQGEAYGLLVELVKKLEAVSGLDIEYQVRPYPRVHRELERGDADFTFLFDFPDAKERVHYSGKVITLRTLVLGTADAPAIDSLDDLSGEKVAYIRGAYYRPEFVQHEGIDQVPVRDFRHGLELLKHHRIAAIIVGEMGVVSEYDPQQDPPIRIMMELDESEGYLFFSKASRREESLPVMRKALETLRKQGELDRLFDKRLDDVVQLD
ncbi:MAG: transporter substrate-binding domain-containing protein [Oleiphilaceae bacterium]|nr:transporter substrate-binding domain-containing protein [Oleiphilaceae bacterium]